METLVAANHLRSLHAIARHSWSPIAASLTVPAQGSLPIKCRYNVKEEEVSAVKREQVRLNERVMMTQREVAIGACTVSGARSICPVPQ